MTAKRRVASKAGRRRADKQTVGGVVDCGSLLPPSWSVLYKFYEHGDVLMRGSACQEDLQIDQFLGGKSAKGMFKGSFRELLDEIIAGNCRAYVPPLFFRFEFYEYDKWGRLVKDSFVLDSQSLAKVLCGATKTLAFVHKPKKSGPPYYYFVLLEGAEAFADKLKFEDFVDAINKLREERKRLWPDSTTALKRLYLSRVYRGVVWEVVVVKGKNRTNLVSAERLPLYNLGCYSKFDKALERSVKYLGDEDAHKLAVEIAESLEAYFETRRIEHLYDALRVLHGVANKENCDVACWYARVLLPGIREVVERGPC